VKKCSSLFLALRAFLFRFFSAQPAQNEPVEEPIYSILFLHFYPT